MDSMRLMPLLEFLAVLVSHVSCNEATLRKYVYYNIGLFVAMQSCSVLRMQHYWMLVRIICG